MSGIFGFWNLDGRPADRSVIRAMSAALAHRGPDGCEVWSAQDVAIGHRLMRTTPEAEYERQPLVTASARVLSADLRLDNREDLIRELDTRGRPAARIPDSELFLQAYDRWGERFPERLLGDFASGLWDEHRRALLCIRDHFGAKPLYYYHAPGRLFAFASEIKALLLLDHVPDDVDELAVARHLLLPVGDDMGSTYYRAIRRVRPGHVLKVTAESIEETPYWTLDPTRVLVLSSDEAYAEALRETVLESVRCRLRSSRPVASMLSGGLDSSSITCAAASILEATGNPERLLTFSGVYPTVQVCDERHYMDAVLAAYDLNPNFFAADRLSPIGDVDRMNWHGDAAIVSGNLYVAWQCYRLAADAGARVILDGFDGDNTLSHGHGLLDELASNARWWQLTREVKALAQNYGEPWTVAVRSWIVGYAVRPMLRRFAPPWARRGTTRNAQRWANGLSIPFRQVVEEHFVPPQGRPRTEREDHYRTVVGQVLTDGLQWVETGGTANGIEVRVPLFDRRLVELCLSFPPEQKLRLGWTRFVMRKAMGGILPEEVRWRPGKSNLTPGLNHALRAHGAEQMASRLASAEPYLSQYVDVDHARQLHRKFMSGSASPDEELQFWRILSLALWLTRSHRASTAHIGNSTRDAVLIPS